jgi:hypothetical protein
MERLTNKCPGDCSRCDMLAAGQVDMVPCILDQMFTRIQRIEASMTTTTQTEQRLASVD